MALTSDAIETLLSKASQAALIDVAEVAGDLCEVPLALVQEGYELKSLEQYQSAPARIKARVALTSPKAFIEYVLRFGHESALVFVDKRTFEARLDYHGRHVNVDMPSWGTHIATYAPKYSHPWTKWAAANGKLMTQVEFALFLESRLNEIKHPMPATLLTAVTNFKEAQECTLQSAQDLSTGEVEFKFVKANVTKSAVFPREMKVVLPVYENHDPVTLELHVRRRVANDGVLTLWVQFKNDVEDIVQAYFDALAMAPIKKALDKKFPVLEGSVNS